MSVNTTESISTMKTVNDSSNGDTLRYCVAPFVGLFWGIIFSIPFWTLIFLLVR